VGTTWAAIMAILVWYIFTWGQWEGTSWSWKSPFLKAWDGFKEAIQPNQDSDANHVHRQWGLPSIFIRRTHQDSSATTA